MFKVIVPANLRFTLTRIELPVDARSYHFSLTVEPRSDSQGKGKVASDRVSFQNFRRVPPSFLYGSTSGTQLHSIIIDIYVLSTFKFLQQTSETISHSAECNV